MLPASRWPVPPATFFQNARIFSSPVRVVWNIAAMTGGLSVSSTFPTRRKVLLQSMNSTMVRIGMDQFILRRRMDLLLRTFLRYHARPIASLAAIDRGDGLEQLGMDRQVASDQVLGRAAGPGRIELFEERRQVHRGVALEVRDHDADREPDLLPFGLGQLEVQLRSYAGRRPGWSGCSRGRCRRPG